MASVMQYAGLKIIDFFIFSKRLMTRFFAPHSFFVIAKVTNINLDYKTQLGHYELPSMNILGKAIRY
jgi:hypothetical protein